MPDKSPSDGEPKILSLKNRLSIEKMRRHGLGIPGLDEHIGGGVLQGSSLLLMGPAGVGKTFFGIQFLLQAMAQGDRGIYLYLGDHSPLLLQSLPFQAELSTLERQYRFQIMTHAIEEGFKPSLEKFLRELEGLESTRVVIEVGLPAEQLSSGQIKFIFEVQARLRASGATTLLSNRSVPVSAENLGPAQYLSPNADGIFMLRYRDLGKDLARELLILNLLGVPHDQVIFKLEFSADGLAIKREMASTEPKTGPARKDRMLISPPIFFSAAEKKQYHSTMKRVLKNMFDAERQPKIHNREMLFYDILTELNAPSTAFGPLLVYDAILPFLARQDLIMPLDTIIPAYEKRFTQASLQKCVINGHLYALPVRTSIRMLFYRKDLLEKYGFKAPATWDELQKIAFAILQAEKNPGLKGLLFYFIPSSQFSFLLDHIWSQGQELYLYPHNWIFNRNGVAEAIRRIDNFFESGICPPTLHTQTYWDPVHEFLEGNSIFLHHWTDTIRLINDDGPDALNKFGWVPLPSSSNDIESHALLGGPSYVIPRRSRFRELAGEFLAHFSTEEIQAPLEQKSGWPYPALNSLYSNEKVMESHPYYSEAKNSLSAGRFIEDLPYIKGNYLNWENAASQVLGEWFSNRSERTTTVDDVVENLEHRLSVFLPKPVYSDLVAKAVEGIHKNLDKPLSIEQLSRELGVSRSHLIRQFKKGTRVTPLKYLNQARIEKAKELLQYTTFNVSEVSRQVGFKSIFHFSKVFRQITGRNPSEYKKFRYQPR